MKHHRCTLGTIAVLAAWSPVVAGPLDVGHALAIERSDQVHALGGPDVLSFDDFAFGTKLYLQVHTDVPDLPRAGTDELPGLGSITDDYWSFGLHAGKDKPDHFFGVHADGRSRIFEEARRTGGLQPGGSGRVHTDVPDLPTIGGPHTSADPIRKPGWGDWTDGAYSRPVLESATIPSPGASLVFVFGGLVAVNRRRRR